MATFEKNTEEFAYRFEETESGLWVEIWHRHGELIKRELIKF